MKLNLTCKISGCTLYVQYSTFDDEWWVDQVTISDDQRHIFGLNSKLKLLNPLKRDRFTGEEGLSVCRTRCTGSFLAGRSINRNGAPPFNPGQAPESAIKKEQQRSQGLHKPQWGSLEKASNCRKIHLTGFMLCHNGSLSWFWVTNFRCWQTHLALEANQKNIFKDCNGGHLVCLDHLKLHFFLCLVCLSWPVQAFQIFKICSIPELQPNLSTLSSEPKKSKGL